MATLQKIRSKGPLLLIVIGLALLAFILGDAWKIMRPNQGVQTIGEISGKAVSALDYQDEVEKYAEVTRFASNVSNLSDEQYASVKDEVWYTMIRKSILENAAEGIGLQVTDAEIQDIIAQGNNSLLRNTPFQNQQTGEFDVDYLMSFLASYAEIDRDSYPAEYLAQFDNMYNFWLYIERELKLNRLYSKYQSLVNNSIITNPVSRKNSYENRMRRSDVLMASVPYSAVSDSLVKITSADVKAVYNEKKELFLQYSDSRDIQYIDVEITPSEADREALLAEVTEYANQLAETTEDYAAFIRLTASDKAFSEVASSAAGLPQDVAARLDSAKVGEVYGPYYYAQDDSYNAFKILSTTMAPDSIQFSIMQVTAADADATAKLADSICSAVKAGGNFEEIAANYGQDGAAQWIASANYESASITGDNAIYLNKLNTMKKGQTEVLKLESATLVISVVDSKNPVKKYNMAIVKRINEFSDETSDDAYNKLSQFVSANNSVDALEASAEENGFRLLSYPNFQSSAYNVAGVAKSHDALRWLFDAKEGEVSKIYEVGDNNDHLLVVALEKIHDKGYRPVEDVATTLQQEAVTNKKAEVLMAKFADVKSIEDAKQLEGVKLDTVKYVNFTTPAYISSTFSSEPAIGAAVYNLDREVLSAPIKGEGGVYVVEKISPDNYSSELDEKAEAERMRSMQASYLANGVLQELYVKANVEDTRYKVF